MRYAKRLNALVLAASILFAPLAAGAHAQNSPRARTPAATRTTPAQNANPATRPAQRRSPTTNVAAYTRPRLVLLIVIDQFRADYLERFGDLFVAGGLGRLMREGAVWTNANYDHIPTETAPGHATMMTGTWPSESGIIGNEWFDRDTGKRVGNASDDMAKLLGGGADEKASSPRRLLASTVGDELRLATAGRSKVIGISTKDRGAILPAGRHATAAYWYSSQVGRMVSSNYYFNQMPDWVTRFNDARPVDKFFGARWERLLPEAEYTRRAGQDAPSWENIGNARDTNTFPHVITGGASAATAREFYDAVNYSPFANDLLVDFAKQALTNESLGADAETDVLSVSFSANDIVGHRFGPYSHEAMDMTLRVDRQIETLLNFVDERVGLRNTLIAFTADHGVALIPEHAAALNLPGGRIKVAEVLTAIRNGIKSHYARPGDSADATADYVLAYSNHNIYFNTPALKRDRINRQEIERVAGEAAMTVPGVGRYFTRTQLESGAISPADAVARRALHGFNPRRSGDVLLMPEAYKYLSDYMTGANHGSAYTYDTHVPLIIMGGALVPGRYAHEAAPSDIAPTLSALLRIVKPSNATGRVLIEAIR